MAVTVKQPDPPIKTEILAEAIVRIGAAAKALREGGLNEEAIIILIQAKAPSGSITRAQVKLVLDSLRRLQGWYCR